MIRHIDKFFGYRAEVHEFDEPNEQGVTTYKVQVVVEGQLVQGEERTKMKGRFTDLEDALFACKHADRF
jgi:hypothetical protein